MIYTPSIVYNLLTGYQRRAQGARERTPEDRLGTQQAPLEEAPWCASSRQWSDIEQAMSALPYNWGHITFTCLCLGGNKKEGTSWRNGMSLESWREKIGDFWGLSSGQVNKIVSESINEMTDSLNGVANDAA